MELACEQVQQLIEWTGQPASPVRDRPRRASCAWQVGLVLSIALHSAAALAIVLWVPGHVYTPPQVLLARGNQGEGDDDRPESTGGSEAGGVAVRQALLRVSDAALAPAQMPELPGALPKPRASTAFDVLPQATSEAQVVHDELRQPAIVPPPLASVASDAPILTARGMDSPTVPRAIGSAPVAADAGDAGSSAAVATGAASTQPSAVALADDSGAGSGGGNGVGDGTGSGGEGGTGRASRGRAGIPDGSPDVKMPKPIYPRELWEHGEHGTVVLRFEIRADGSIGQIEVISDAGYPRLAQAAIAAVRKAKIRPALEDGKPISLTVTQSFNFVPPK